MERNTTLIGKGTYFNSAVSNRFPNCYPPLGDLQYYPLKFQEIFQIVSTFLSLKMDEFKIFWIWSEGGAVWQVVHCVCFPTKWYFSVSRLRSALSQVRRSSELTGASAIADTMDTLDGVLTARHYVRRRQT